MCQGIIIEGQSNKYCVANYNSPDLQKEVGKVILDHINKIDINCDNVGKACEKGPAAKFCMFETD